MGVVHLRILCEPNKFLLGTISFFCHAGRIFGKLFPSVSRTSIEHANLPPSRKSHTPPKLFGFSYILNSGKLRMFFSRGEPGLRLIYFIFFFLIAVYCVLEYSTLLCVFTY